jgi:hypothetical protein
MWTFLALLACDEPKEEGAGIPELPEEEEEESTECDTSLDRDCDGSLDGDDCDPDDGLVYEGAPEVPYDGKDNDCDPSTSDDDLDGDGFVGIGAGGDDCDDNRVDVYPGAEEICYDGIDQDCAGDVELENANDCDGDGYQGRGTEATDCDDTDPEVNPEGIEIWYDGVDQDCDFHNDYDADYDDDLHLDHGGADCDDEDPLTRSVDPDAGIITNERWDLVDRDCNGVQDDLGTYDADLSYYASSASGDGWIGKSMAFMDDLDGDGFSELAMGSPYAEYDASGIPKGRVYVFSIGQPDGVPEDVALTTIIGDNAAFVGYDLDRIGDLDGDGLSELAVGAYGKDKTIVFTGAQLQSGGTLSMSDGWATVSGVAYLGVDVTRAGDITGDGVPDLVTGTGPGGSAAWVGIWDGASLEEGGGYGQSDTVASLTGSSDGGESAGGGDFDGDGLADLLVPYGSHVAMAHGSGLSGGAVIDMSDLPSVWGSMNTGFGNHTGVVYDLDGDGYDEALVSAPFANPANQEEGTVFLVDGDEFPEEGGAASDLARIQIHGAEKCGTLLGMNQSGDFDADGIQDIIVSQAFIPTGCSPTSNPINAKAHVFYGAELQDGSYQSSEGGSFFSSRYERDGLGIGIAVQDIDSDGDADLALGAPYYNEFVLPDAGVALNYGYSMLFLSQL